VRAATSAPSSPHVIGAMTVARLAPVVVLFGFGAFLISRTVLRSSLIPERGEPHYELRSYPAFNFHSQKTHLRSAGGHDLCVTGGVTTLAQGRPVIFGILNAIFVGTSVGLFEEFYVQTLRGRWMRSIHPIRSIVVYTIFVVIMFMISINLTHILLYQFYPLPVPYQRLPFVLPIVIAFSVIGIVVMRTVHFIGIETLFHLMVGTYHRPVVQEKVIVFLGINDSTSLAERLGAVQTKSLVGKFLFDISKPITDYGGEIYLYKGDGLIARRMMRIWGYAGKQELTAILTELLEAERAGVRVTHESAPLPPVSGR
jgi:hypothetical protein